MACLLPAVVAGTALGCTYQRQLPEVVISGQTSHSDCVGRIDVVPPRVVLHVDANASDYVALQNTDAREVEIGPGECAAFVRGGHGEETWRFVHQEAQHAIMHVAGSYMTIGFWPFGPQVRVCFDRDALVCTRAAATDGAEQIVVRLASTHPRGQRPPVPQFMISGPRVRVQPAAKPAADQSPSEQSESWVTPEQEFEVPGCNMIETWKLLRIDVDTNHAIFSVRGRVYYCTDPFAIFLGIPSHSYTETVVVCLPVTGESAAGPVHTSHTSARDAIAGACE